MSVTCINHPDREAFSQCYFCKKCFCKSCLEECDEYFYCDDPKCRESLKVELLPQIVECPECSSELEINFEERIEKKFHCPVCECFLDFSSEPPKVIDPEKYEHVLTTLNQGDLAVIQSVFDAKKIQYFIYGENFLSVDPLIQGARIHVLEEHVERAKELLKDIDIHLFGTSASENK